MIVLEHPFQDLVKSTKSLELFGLGLVSMTQNKFNIILMKGINSSLLLKLIRNYKEEIIKKEEGKLIDLIGSYTVYIHFFKVDKGTLSIFYINEKDKNVNYDDLCSLSSQIFNEFCSNHSHSSLNAICTKVVARLPDASVSAFFIVSSAGHSLFSKIKENYDFLKKNIIQIGGFISAVFTFSSEIIGRESVDHLSSINFENRQFLVNKVNDVIFACFTENNDSKEIKKNIDLIAEEFFDRYEERVKNFDGDVSVFNEFESVIDKYFTI